MSWSDVLPIKHMVAMLERTFFPKWLQVLCTWMSNMPNYEEITKWYLGWKSLFSEEYRNYPPITGKLSKDGEKVLGQFWTIVLLKILGSRNIIQN